MASNFIDQITQPLLDTLEAAQERGDLDASVDCEFEATMLAGPLLHEHLVAHRDIMVRLVDTTASRWLATHGKA